MAGPVDKYAVLGNPVAHSKSPRIHTMFASQTEQRLQYNARLVPVDGFDEAINHFFKEEFGGHGLSITVPFKEQAWECAQHRTARAEKAGAVNTLWITNDGVIHGDNTDGLGLVRDLSVNHQVELENKRILILGAGGAVRGVLEPLLEQKPSELVVANRTVSKAEALVELFPEKPVSACGFTDLSGNFDLIINGTSASLQGDLPPLPVEIVAEHTICYDMMYASETTVFNQWGLAHGARQALDGLGMLVEQAAEQFLIWRGVRPDTAPVLLHLREDMSA
ncbi:shikimate dehydrogenase [Endozoicomonas montiporae]|uniref:Shikimate dehydrogenase (NADP(+)) n=2 Tax=Endozoicomonas montiporae TaxID=1027273 RepID=A0A081N081_9GAMM|nr:shikimate dehydrogenase [Endozoicomonas montiporae]AMO54307.1 dehydroshikimate reductase [Endozoicomonas montiporae CL-33]KEQ11854.1 shikimate dehydrogenase [Endozoicomonas montiporae]